MGKIFVTFKNYSFIFFSSELNYSFIFFSSDVVNRKLHLSNMSKIWILDKHGMYITYFINEKHDTHKMISRSYSPLIYQIQWSELTHKYKVLPRQSFKRWINITIVKYV